MTNVVDEQGRFPRRDLSLQTVRDLVPQVGSHSIRQQMFAVASPGLVWQTYGLEPSKEFPEGDVATPLSVQRRVDRCQPNRTGQGPDNRLKTGREHMRGLIHGSCREMLYGSCNGVGDHLIDCWA